MPDNKKNGFRSSAWFGPADDIAEHVKRGVSEAGGLPLLSCL